LVSGSPAARRASLMSGNKANVAGDTLPHTHPHTYQPFAHYNTIKNIYMWVYLCVSLVGIVVTFLLRNILITVFNGKKMNIIKKYYFLGTQTKLVY